MTRKSINFNNEEINESIFYKNKKLFNTHDLDVNKMLVSKKESNYFIGVNDDDAIRPLCVKLPQTIGYVKHIVIRQCYSGLLRMSY